MVNIEYDDAKDEQEVNDDVVSENLLQISNEIRERNVEIRLDDATNKINEDVTNVEEIAEDGGIEEDEEDGTNEEEVVTLKKSERIKVPRVYCNKGQEKSVNKMMRMNKKIIKNVKEGDLVLLSVPDVDRGP